jgi:hypothetical protein
MGFQLQPDSSFIEEWHIPSENSIGSHQCHVVAVWRFEQELQAIELEKVVTNPTG